MILSTKLTVYTTTATWFKAESLQFVDVVLRGAGGGGSTDTGGGGGGAVDKRIGHDELPDLLTVSVGAGGTSGEDGTPTRFGELLTAENGRGGLYGGVGGLSYMRGGNGGVANSAGQSVTSEVVRLLAGGGGGAGSGSVGGRSGFTPANTSNPAFWQWLQSGGGGNSGQFGGFPAGGGGAGAPGANGVCTVIEYHREEY